MSSFNSNAFTATVFANMTVSGSELVQMSQMIQRCMIIGLYHFSSKQVKYGVYYSVVNNIYMYLHLHLVIKLSNLTFL